MIKQLRTAVFENGTQKAREYAENLYKEITTVTGMESSIINVYDTRPCTQLLPVRAIPNVAVLLFADTLEEGEEIVEVIRQLQYFRNQEEIEQAGEKVITDAVAAGAMDGSAVVDSMVLDRWDNRGTQTAGYSLMENPAFRRKLNQLKLTEPEVVED